MALLNTEKSLKRAAFSISSCGSFLMNPRTGNMDKKQEAWHWLSLETGRLAQYSPYIGIDYLWKHCACAVYLRLLSHHRQVIRLDFISSL